MLKKHLLSSALVLAGLLTSSSALASHFRYGTIAWRVPNPAAPTTVEFTVTTAWRAASPDLTALDFGDGSNNGSVQGTAVGTGVDALGQAYAVYTYTATHTYATAGAFSASYSSCCRIGGLQNGASGNFTVSSAVDLTAGNFASPTSSSPAVVQMQVGNVRSYTFPAFDSDGDPVTCRFATAAESGLPAGQELPAVPNGGAKPTLTSVANGCRLDWDVTKAVTGQQYATHVMLESKHGGKTSSTPLDLIVEMVTPPPPACAGSGVSVASVGQPFSTAMTGTDQTAGVMKLSVVGLPAGATMSPAGGSSGASPFASTLAWTPTAAQAGSTNIVQVNYTNSLNLTGTCFLTIEVPRCPGYGAPCSVGVGACHSTGTSVCSGTQTVCSAVAGTPTAEVCDGKDNNCDGQVDEGNPQSGQSCASGLPGVCATGKTDCSNGALACQAVVSPGAQVESCDGLDNDCDGQTDEDFDLGTACSQGLGTCQASGVVVCGGGVGVCSAVPGQPTVEACDGLDNDCDGQVDNGNPGSGQACASGLVGACAAGKTTCASGALQCAPDVTPGQLGEVCDGLDNDCDGQTDEGFNVGASCNNGQGQCVASGLVACLADGTSACNAVAGTPAAESCDGLDNDCDGQVDNGQPGAGQACASGVPGVCAAGSTACSGGGIACVPNVAPGSLIEACDGLDNDCDGQADEGFNLGDACVVGIGACARQGQLACDSSGGSSCDVAPGQPAVEVCDGLDNDCDGEVDNGNPGSGQDCTTELVGVCAAGKTTCQADGTLGCVADVKPGTKAEVCDGLDNNCDGQTDEEFNVGAPCSAGVGACQQGGQLVCDGSGGVACTAQAGEPTAEICADGTDSDCDTIDSNGCACLADADCGDAQSGAYCDNTIGGTFTCLPGCRAQGGNGCPTPSLCTSIDTTPGACVQCLGDADCGDAASGLVCNGTTSTCLKGCRGAAGNACPAGKVCTSDSPSIGACVQCTADADCGGADSGRVCDPAQNICLDGCRVAPGGNGCPAALVCTSTTAAAGECVACVADADCGDPQSGSICQPQSHTCAAGCRGQGGNGCPASATCTSTTSAAGTCVGCVTDADCGDATSGQVCEASACVTGCRGQDGNGCPAPLTCTSTTGNQGQCVGCTTDGQCGGPASGLICVADACVTGCRGQGGNGCAAPGVCTSQTATAGTCVACVVDADCGGPQSGQVCHADTHTCADGCRGQGGNGCPAPGACTSSDATPGVCVGCTSDAGCPDGQVCHAATSTCQVGCRAGQATCPAGTRCDAAGDAPGQCVAGCTSDAGCGAGQVCSDDLTCATGCRPGVAGACPAGTGCVAAASGPAQCVATTPPAPSSTATPEPAPTAAATSPATFELEGGCAFTTPAPGAGYGSALWLLALTGSMARRSRRQRAA